MILCKNGHPNEDGATYCQVCKVYIDSSAQAAAPSQPEPPKPEPPKPEPAGPEPPIVSLSHASVTAPVGGEGGCEVRVHNPGGTPDEYVIEIAGDAAPFAKLDPWLLPLGPGASGAASIMFRPSLSADAEEAVRFEIRVTPAQLPDKAVSVPGALEIVPAQALPAELPAVVSEVPLGRVTGLVRGLAQRVERGSGEAPMPEIIFTFRVERQDEHGRPVGLVPVEMRALSFRGGIAEGDNVEIDQPWEPGETLSARRVRNLTTGSWFLAKGSRRRNTLIGLVIFLVIVGVMIGLALHFHPWKP
jgi:hypothetical protein